MTYSRYCLGVTGGIATGKSSVCDYFLKLTKEKKAPCQVISIDELRRFILTRSKSIKNIELRKKLSQKLNLKAGAPFFYIGGEALGNRIFYDEKSMDQYRSLLLPELHDVLSKKLKKAKSMIIIEWACLIEDNFLPLTSHLILTHCPPKVQKKRLAMNADISLAQLKKRLAGQSSFIWKKSAFKKYCDSVPIKDRPQLSILDTSVPNEKSYQNLFNLILKNSYHEL